MHDIGSQFANSGSENPAELRSNQVTPDSLSNYSLSEIADLINIIQTKNLELSREKSEA
jgi:hypothetical protein